MSYSHRPDLAPTQLMFDDFKKHATDGATGVEDAIPQELLDNSVLLYSEDNPHQCHRRLVAEYLAQHWDCARIEHLT
ncbi:DUF488 family protein [Nocardia sp. NPDC004654]|uniref:DUF488 family protein n=1 Tax=Nocardia sp. NPDC004654 TaxID=3154776 RepID=UPI0033B6B7D5